MLDPFNPSILVINMEIASINIRLQNLVIDPLEPFKSLKKEDRLLNDGAFGRVYRCFNEPDGEVVCVVKEVDIPQKEPSRTDRLKIIDQELSVVTALEKLEHHPNIVRFLQCVKSDIKLMVFMEYMEGDLNSFISIKGKQSDKTVLAYLKQITNGLMFLHSHGIAHYDLKSENILVDNEEHPCILKIADYGNSKLFSTGNATTVGYKGTIKFMAPEVYASKDNDKKKPGDLLATFNTFSEIWSLGVIGLHLVTGLLEWNNPADIPDELDRYAITTEADNSVAELLKSFLVIDPQNRCDVDTAMKLIENIQLPKVGCEVSLSSKEAPQLKSDLISHFTHHHQDDSAIEVAVQIIKSFYNRDWFVVSCNTDDDVSHAGLIIISVDDRQHLFYPYHHPEWIDATATSVKSYLDAVQWTTKSADDVKDALRKRFTDWWCCVISSTNETRVYGNDLTIGLDNGCKFMTVIKRVNGK